MVGFFDDYPPSAFYFTVTLGITLGLADTSFQEVSGIGSEIETESVTEGGENQYTHTLPKAIKHQNLVLKRGIGKITSPLVLWCKSVMESDFVTSIVPMPLMVSLLNEYKIPIRVWSFTHAYPVKWEVDAFNSTKNEVAIEKIELTYNSATRMM